MADELELLRRANPVPADSPALGDGPLDRRAEQGLQRLLHGEPPRPRSGLSPEADSSRPRGGLSPEGDPSRARGGLLPEGDSPRARGGLLPEFDSPRRRTRLLPGRRPALPLRRPHVERPPRRIRLLPAPPGRTPRARLLWGLAATVVVLVIAVDAVLGGPSTSPAVAAPRPLTVHLQSRPVPLEEMIALADAATADHAPGLRKGTHVQSWSVALRDDERPVTLPEERVVRWRADGSHTELVMATDPRRPGRPVLTDDGDEPREVADGHVVSRTTYPPMWSDAPPEGTPPHTAAALRAYLTEVVRPGRHRGTAPLSTPELLEAVGELLDHWTLGARESAALVRLLARADGLRPAGEVTDRLGRPGHAYEYQRAGIRRLLILEPRTGAVLGMEDTATEDDPEYGVRAGDLMQYRAWMR
ncbi:CU044_5270 family protein [Streptomyces actinomycinicus]|uniref:CU044_5270 family protein n=1 Tax=Streptomyces actinomycinicus TaxID=1695166 RepID=A0A937ELS7_9ACTN|nr:CU044_5270 family protein [Streptomyces actinomycinicus]MBL1084379.1 CU044_5270 family protein [Streptomyces actinomycinicus]